MGSSPTTRKNMVMATALPSPLQPRQAFRISPYLDYYQVSNQFLKFA